MKNLLATLIVLAIAVTFVTFLVRRNKTVPPIVPQILPPIAQDKDTELPRVWPCEEPHCKG